MRHLVPWLLCVLASLAGCRRPPPPPPIATCPALVVGTWTWVGVIGPPGTVEPLEQVALYDRGELLAYGVAYATVNGSFAIRGALRATAASRVELVAASGRRFSVYAGRPEARVTYAEGDIPVLEDPLGVMTFHGWLESTYDSTPIERAWAANWATGEVAPITPTPVLDQPIEGARVAGTLGHCMTVFSEHASGGTGGCWFRRRGGCLCRRCSAEQLADGTCEEPSDVSENGEDPRLPCGCGRQGPSPGAPAASPGGRTPLPADERHDPPPRGGPPPPYGPEDPYAPPPPTPVPAPAAIDASYRHVDAGPVEPPS